MSRKSLVIVSMLLAFISSAAEFVLFKDGKPAAVIEKASFAKSADLN